MYSIKVGKTEIPALPTSVTSPHVCFSLTWGRFLFANLISFQNSEMHPLWPPPFREDRYSTVVLGSRFVEREVHIDIFTVDLSLGKSDNAFVYNSFRWDIHLKEICHIWIYSCLNLKIVSCIFWNKSSLLATVIS